MSSAIGEQMQPGTIAILYHSITGTTAALAEQIERGISSIDGATALPFQIQGADIIEGRYSSDKLTVLNHVDAIIFGSPTYMGNVSAQFKAAADASSPQWSEGLWRNKIAAGFSIGDSPSGEQEVTMYYLQTLAAQHGMIWVGLDVHRDDINEQGETLNRLGASAGLIAQAADNMLDQVDLRTAFHLGRRVAGLVHSPR